MESSAANYMLGMITGAALIILGFEVGDIIRDLQQNPLPPALERSK